MGKKWIFFKITKSVNCFWADMKDAKNFIFQENVGWVKRSGTHHCTFNLNYCQVTERQIEYSTINAGQ